MGISEKECFSVDSFQKRKKYRESYVLTIAIFSIDLILKSMFFTLFTLSGLILF